MIVKLRSKGLLGQPWVIFKKNIAVFLQNRFDNQKSLSFFWESADFSDFQKGVKQQFLICSCYKRACFSCWDLCNHFYWVCDKTPHENPKKIQLKANHGSCYFICFIKKVVYYCIHCFVLNSVIFFTLYTLEAETPEETGYLGSCNPILRFPYTDPWNCELTGNSICELSLRIRGIQNFQRDLLAMLFASIFINKTDHNYCQQK